MRWATKNVLVDHSAETLGSHWDGEIANERNIATKPVQACSNSRLKCNSVLKLKQSSLCGEAGYPISKSCGGQVTKKYVGGSNLGYCCALG